MLNALHMQCNTIIERGAHKMGLMTFKGGVHPSKERIYQKISQYVNYYPKVNWYIRYRSILEHRQHQIVAVGDSVLKGQKIAEAGGFVSAPIHASVSGTVKKIEPRRVPTGDMVNSIVIKAMVNLRR